MSFAPTSAQLKALAAEGYNRVPLTRAISGDYDTPLSVYRKLADAPNSYLFESVMGGERWGRYSIIGLAARTVLRVYGHKIEVRRDNELIETTEADDPLAWVESFKGRFRVFEPEGMPRFHGGLVGYFGFETIRYIEPRLAASPPKPDPLGTPDILLMVSEQVVVVDNLSSQLLLVTLVDPAQADALEAGAHHLDALTERLRSEQVHYAPLAQPRHIDENDFTASFTREGYESAVLKIREYIAAGDVMQVVPSQRMTIGYDAPPIDLYRALRSLNPSPYMYYIDCGDHQVIGSSPEILARLEDNEITVRPIAGTRPRGKTHAEDLALEQELLSDPKEIAEHVMLIDLGRSDTGRVAEIGSVKLEERMIIERYSHVMHIVSQVTGQLKAGLNAIDVLRATFPAGTVSGAPKIRALEIIDELEPVKRGVYAGAVGYWAWNGNMDTAIAIRTGVLKDGELHIQAGGGIVADSIPANEWEETLNKRRALFRAAAVAQAGVDGAVRRG
ncbi:anthranilate synthase component I [Halothiobacillus neapolitanus]|uniref:Anthranilate synthase component 1 n=1 Tax=Halothiobacillus neapolitanus (strain ATCC 23641 / DSM 15147 / CIP 104769 / NCIMB 8539 / c2) TaxID=555778 RepID=D0KW23_HALNC|nr:anthranilate synthase component I [Halothiobacillus neapolitanus]ACX96926.1 anthranilate synthase component I [Halothiobacillus neapolitanus c2]TDN64959.1 anthranilate synthase component I [Halothiobacillus neapolitanus]